MANIKYHTAFILLLMVATPASAAIITDGTYIQVQTDIDAGSGPAAGGVTRITAATTADTGLIAANNGSFNANGRAFANVTGSPDLKVVSSSTAPAAVSSFASSSSTLVRSSWRDLLIPGAAGAPSSVDFNFSVHARLNVSQTTDSGISGTPNFSLAGVSIITDNSILGFLSGTILSGRAASIQNLNGGVTQTTLSGGALDWDTALFTEINPNEYDFNGSFTFSSPLLSFTDPDAPFGAYFIGVGLSSQTSNVGGTSTADAFNTISLDSITLPTGENLPSTINFNFESGASISSVPLPSSFFLMLSVIVAAATMLRQKTA